MSSFTEIGNSERERELDLRDRGPGVPSALTIHWFSSPTPTQTWPCHTRCVVDVGFYTALCLPAQRYQSLIFQGSVQISPTLWRVFKLLLTRKKKKNHYFHRIPITFCPCYLYDFYYIKLSEYMTGFGYNINSLRTEKLYLDLIAPKIFVVWTTEWHLRGACCMVTKIELKCTVHQVEGLLCT